MVQDGLVLIRNLLNVLWVLFFSMLVMWYLRYHWKKRHLYLAAWKRSGPLSLPFFGNALIFVGSTSKSLEKINLLTRQYESPVPIWFGPKLMFIISEPKDLDIVMNSPNALAKGDAYKFVKTFMGEGLFVAAPSKWKRHKKIIMPTLSQNILNNYVTVFGKHSDVLIDQLLKEVGNGEFDVFRYVSNCALDNLCETVMGLSVNAQTTNTEYIDWATKAMDICFKRMVNIWYHSDFIFSLSSYSAVYYKSIRKMNAFIDKVVRQKREEYRAQCTKKQEFCEGKSFLQLLIELSENGTMLSDQELREEVATFMIGGTETYASLISYLFIILGMNLEIQEKVYREVIDVLGPSRSVEYTDLNKFFYMERVIRETLRLFPPGSIIGRSVSKDIKLEKCILPAGSSVLLSIIGLHWNPSIYPEPFKFDPDRFLAEEVGKRHPYSWLPFSGGLRNCVGSKYAYMAMKSIIASVVRKYKFLSKYKRIEDIGLKMEFMLRPVEGFNVSIELRK